MSPLISLTTDFGVSSPYVAAMKGVIWGIHPRAQVVDLTHAIPPQNIRQAAVVLRDFTSIFPPHTIHLAVVDPGVGTPRKILYARLGEQHYVGPDNGLFSLLLRDRAADQLISVENPRFWRDEVSRTFHGRDVMAPVAAHLSRGVDPARLGPKLTDFYRLNWPEVAVGQRSIAGHVIAVDSFGNLLTDVSQDLLSAAACPANALIRCGEHRIAGILATYGDQRKGRLIALIGSSQRLEIAVVAGNAAEVLGIRPTEEVVLRW